MSKILTLLLFTMITGLYAQDMSTLHVGRDQIKENFQNIADLLREDTTDLIKYDYGKFTCHNYAKKLYLERSILATNLEDFDLEGIEKEWGVRINRDEKSLKEEIYLVTLVSEEKGFFHAINAVLINKNKPELIESYLFIKPQTDGLMETKEALYSHYQRYYHEAPLSVSIGTFSGFKFNGNIYQSFQKNLYNFTLKK